MHKGSFAFSSTLFFLDRHQDHVLRNAYKKGGAPYVYRQYAHKKTQKWALLLNILEPLTWEKSCLLFIHFGSLSSNVPQTYTILAETSKPMYHDRN